MGSPVRGSALVSQTTSKPSSPYRVSVSASLTCLGVTLPFQALVDSGADDNFIDVDLVNQLQIPLQPPAEPQNTNALDGRLIATATQCTVSVSLVISGNYHKKIQLCV